MPRTTSALHITTLLAPTASVPAFFTLAKRFLHNLNHSLNKLIDLFLSVAPVSPAGLVVPVPLAFETLPGRAQFERPQEVIGLLEMGTAGVDFVNKVFDAMNAVLTKLLRNRSVVLQPYTRMRSPLPHLSVATLVD